MAKKRKLEDYETIKLTKECNTIFTKKAAPKGERHWHSTFDKALCDLDASINLMSLLVFRKLGLSEVKPTTISFQMVDHSLTFPRRIIEDVLVKVDKFIFQRTLWRWIWKRIQKFC